MATCSSAFAPKPAPPPLFIIALLLVKSKPATIPIKVYLAELRTLIKGEPRSEDKSELHTHLDAINYWRAVFNVSQEENRSLRTHIAKLEGKNENHTSSDAYRPLKEDQNIRLSRRKRKRSPSITRARSTRIAKQARLANTSSPMQSRHIDLLITNPASGPLTPRLVPSSIPNTPANEFLHQIDVLQRLISVPTSEPETIGSCLLKLLETISSLVSVVHEAEDQNQATKQSRTDSRSNELAAETPSIANLKSITSLIPVLLQAMDHVTLTNRSPALVGLIIYRWVEIYSTILHQLCDLAAHDRPFSARASSVPGHISAHARRDQSAASNTWEMTKPPFSKRSDILLSLSDLAIAMTTTLQPDSPDQARILEGCLSHLLTKVGNGLRTSIFGTKEAANNATSNETQGGGEEEEREDPDHDHNHDLEAEANRMLEAQAPYLIYILERTPTKPRLASTAQSQSQTQTQTQFQTPSNAILRLARKKLQNTLLRAVFPEHTLGLMMQQALNVPEEPPPPLQQQQQFGTGTEAVVEVREWFKSEVWRLVGWDALDEYLRVGVW